LFLNKLIAGCAFLMLVIGVASSDGLPSGVMEGHLKIVSLKEVELADGNAPAVTAETYSEYPLIILNREKKEITRVTADMNGNYRVTLPPGNYVLDVQGRAPGYVRAKPQPFTVVSNRTLRVDMDIDTGIR
jgi:hypothetical protein